VRGRQLLMNENNTKITEHDKFEISNEYDFSKGIRGRFYKPHKKLTTIRLDDDIILYFKKLASEQKVGYQTLLNLALREYIQHHIQ